MANLSWLSVRKCVYKKPESGNSPIEFAHPFTSSLHNESCTLYPSCHHTLLCAGSQLPYIHLAPLSHRVGHCSGKPHKRRCSGYFGDIWNSSEFLVVFQVITLVEFSSPIPVWYLVRALAISFGVGVALKEQNEYRAPCFYDSQGDRTCFKAGEYQILS